MSALAIPGTAGIMSAFDTLNEDEGGIDGHPIEYTVYDTISTAEGAQAALQRAIDSEPHVIMLSTLSSNAAAIVPQLELSGIPVMWAGAMTPDLANPDDPARWVFSVSGHMPQIASANVGFAPAATDMDLDGMGVALHSIDTANSNLIVELSGAYAETFGAEVVAREKVPPSGLTSYASQAANIARENPDVLIASDSASNTAIWAPALRTAGFTGPIINGEGAADGALFEALGDDQYNAIINYRTTDLSEEMYDAAVRFGHETNGTLFGPGWVSAHITAQVLAACGFDCNLDSYIETAEGYGDFDIPGDAAFGPPSYGPNKHFAVTAMHAVRYNRDTGKVELVGEPLDVTNFAEVPTP